MVTRENNRISKFWGLSTDAKPLWCENGSEFYEMDTDKVFHFAEDAGWVYASHTLSTIAITTPPTKTTYWWGETFDATGMVVTATYSDESTVNLTSIVDYSKEPLTASGNVVVRAYWHDLNQAVTVNKKLEKIKVETLPTKTAYLDGDSVDMTGAVVKGYYNDGTNATITEYTTVPASTVALTDTKITVSYTENGITKTDEFPIVVTKKLSSIAITTAPTKTTYTAGETFDPDGMVVTATYSDTSTQEVTNYTYSPTAALTTDDTSITVTFVEAEVSKTATQAITVNAEETTEE